MSALNAIILDNATRLERCYEHIVVTMELRIRANYLHF